MLLVYLASAWIAGLAFSNQINLPRDLLLWWLVFPVLSFFFARQNPRLRLLFLTLTFFLLGAIRFTLARPSADPNALAVWNDRGAMTLTGEVIDDPDVRDQHVNLRVNITRVRVQSATHTVSGLALVQAPREVQVRYGDQLEFFGEPITPPEFADFSYKEYLARQDIHSIVRVYSAPKIIAREQGNPFFAALYAFRHRALDTVYAIFPEPAASLLAGILLGVDSGIPSDLRDAFSATNTAHIIAISGFNVSIIAGILTQLARRVWSAGRATIIVLVGLAGYTLLVGASASVLRAAIMGALVVIAAYLNRSSTAYIALAVAAFVMTALNPFTLFDLGFQLSFLATLGLILYTEPLEKLFARVIARSRFASLTVNSATKQSPNSNLEIASSSRSARLLAMTKDTFISTLAAQITTTPLIIFAFHRLSIIGLVTNFLVLPAQPAVMIWGGLATLVGMIAPPVGQLIGWIAWTFTEWTIVIVQFTARLPFAAIPIGYFDAIIVGAYYFILFGATRVDWKTVREKISLRPALALASAFIVLILVFNLALTAPDGKTHIEFFDAGGAATFIRAPNGAKI
ncbi:MAG: ComEC/Rec2 family competence protein, partial [Chloroflexi bacterium]|nr:ComEC/Rec2 family competence protein [Chloroflexota bacterium]